MLSSKITTTFVKSLIASQFPEWMHLPVSPVKHGGHDNRTFHLGDQMLVRMPSGEEYAPKVVKEQFWLPRLAPQLPLPIPEPLAMGEPGEGYPWKWSIYRWMEGEPASIARIENLEEFAEDLAKFLIAFQSIDTAGGPVPYDDTSRGGPISIYDEETRQSIEILRNKIDTKAATKVWETALETTWSNPPVWVHGDVALGNLLVKNGRLSSVIDFGGLVAGDPACDLVINWTFFKGKSREVFRERLKFDEGTWARGRAWALWKALIVASGDCENPGNYESKRCWEVIAETLEGW